MRDMGYRSTTKATQARIGGPRKRANPWFEAAVGTAAVIVAAVAVRQL